MKTYMIDGNNLIGKIKFLNQLQLKEKQSSREKLVFIVDNFFTGKNIKVLLFFAKKTMFILNIINRKKYAKI